VLSHRMTAVVSASSPTVNNSRLAMRIKDSANGDEEDTLEVNTRFSELGAREVKS
jgi:hypothetical protein